MFIAMMYTNGSKDSLDSCSCCMPKLNYYGYARLTSSGIWLRQETAAA